MMVVLRNLLLPCGLPSSLARRCLQQQASCPSFPPLQQGLRARIHVSSRLAFRRKLEEYQNQEEEEEEEEQDDKEEEIIEEEESDDASLGHTPVLQEEVLAAFQDVKLRTFVDCTLGAAGHASAIIKCHEEMETFVGLDVDPVAHSKATTQLQDVIEVRRKMFSSLPELTLHTRLINFKNVKTVIEQLCVSEQGVDGILMDLGMSSMQLHGAKRGFSLQHDAPLDMRMDPSSFLTAKDILNNWPETEIGRILREYGEEKQWRRLSKKISEAQLAGGIHSTLQLLELIQAALPLKFSPGRPGWKKTAIRVFQALRIAVNDELAALEAALPDVYECLNPGGRMAVISFHSLEDRIVKQFFLKVVGEVTKVKLSKSKCNESRDQDNSNGVIMDELERSNRGSNRILEGSHAIVLTRKPIIAKMEEVKQNPKARSAKLRILEKKSHT